MTSNSKTNFLIDIKDVPLISESLYFYVIQPVIKLVWKILFHFNHQPIEFINSYEII